MTPLSQAIDADIDAKIDAYHDGWAAHKAGRLCPADRDGADGWNDRAKSLLVRVVMIERPEGYYHVKPDGE